MHFSDSTGKRFKDEDLLAGILRHEREHGKDVFGKPVHYV